MRIAVFIAGLLATLLTSCSNEPSLQKYFVEHTEEKNFMTLDIAPNLLKSDSIKLSADEKAALESVKKLNVLFFQKDSLGTNAPQYEKEKKNVKELLKDEQYDELMHFGSNKAGVSVHTVGENDDIDEFVLFMHQEENGFGVIRVLGDNMNPNHALQMMELLQKGNLNIEQFKPIQEMMVPKQ
ncbi:DUF4252 domain-containing protein [Flavobacterium sp.]|uniref:DUF4252 domain-containing protein n=1 Tax=Flavobacterium sp. TaxID=239 RepID=UPI0026276812|nr:DUF4252 domain-containing protein [Flavobacterium sp.]